MSLSKRAKRGIAAFQRAANPIYSAQRIRLSVSDPKIESYIAAYLEAKGEKS